MKGEVMQKNFALKIGVMAVSGLLVCFAIALNPVWAASASKYKNFPVPEECMQQVQKESKTLHIYNWAEYYPQKLYDKFEEEFGIKIVEDHYADSNEMLTKFKLNPKTPYDVVIGGAPRHSIVLEKMDALVHLNHDWIPNVDAYLLDDFKEMNFDPGNTFQIPTYTFTTVFAYNSKYVDPNEPLLDSWKFIFEGPKKYRNKITMLDNHFHTIGTALKALGYAYTSDNKEELMQAKELLLKQKASVMAYDSWPRRLIVEEQAWISHSWTGDMWYASRDQPAWRNVLPKEGSYWSVESVFIPKGAKSPAAAHLFLNFLFRTDMNALTIETVGYPPVHKHVMEFMSDEMKAWPGFILDPEYMKKCDGVNIRAFTGKGEELRQKIWMELKK
jgi:spermidine/putrescine transport system substrate-binding protein